MAWVLCKFSFCQPSKSVRCDWILICGVVRLLRSDKASEACRASGAQRSLLGEGREIRRNRYIVTRYIIINIFISINNIYIIINNIVYIYILFIYIYSYIVYIEEQRKEAQSLGVIW